MKKKEQKIQLILISIGLFLIMLTYFYFPKKSINKTLENETVREEVQDPSIDGEGPFSTFENVVYEGLYDLDKPFSIQSKKCSICCLYIKFLSKENFLTFSCLLFGYQLTVLFIPFQLRIPLELRRIHFLLSI